MYRAKANGQIELIQVYADEHVITITITYLFVLSSSFHLIYLISIVVVIVFTVMIKA